MTNFPKTPTSFKDIKVCVYIVVKKIIEINKGTHHRYSMWRMGIIATKSIPPQYVISAIFIGHDENATTFTYYGL